jgi:hypothetical protein
MSRPRKPLNVFVSYAHKDERFRRELIKALAPLKREGLITHWDDVQIPAGHAIDPLIADRLRTSDLILLLISNDFIASRYCYDVEMAAALERHRTGQALVVPLIVRPTDWRSSPFANLKALPTDGVPMTSRKWRSLDEAMTSVTGGLRDAVGAFIRFRQLRRRRLPRPTDRKKNAGSVNADMAAFRNEVANTYSLLGYRVSDDPSVCRQGTDLVCELALRGTPVIRLLVRCEFQNTKRSSPSSLQPFLRDFLRLKRSQSLVGAVLIYDSARVTRPTRSHASLRVMSMMELVSELLNAKLPLRQYVTSYERAEIYSLYLSLRARRLAAADKKSTNPQKGDRAIIVDEFLQSWLTGKGSLLTLLGDFGTGKTTVLERLKYSTANRYLAGQSALVPIYMSLRNFEQVGHLERFVEDRVEQELGLRLTYHRFVELLRRGTFVLFLDGFDEMGRQIDAETRRHHFQALLPLLLESHKTILSCRPAYFLTSTEMNEVLALFSDYNPKPSAHQLRSDIGRAHAPFVESVRSWIAADTKHPQQEFGRVERLELLPLSGSDIDRYVATTSVNDRFGVRSRIRKTYDLEDLATRPILLAMILKTLPELPSDKEASPSVIYEAYTSGWMSHDYGKGDTRTLVPASEKRTFMETLAWQMILTGETSLHFTLLDPYLSAFFKASGRMRDFIATHIQACSFLVRDQDGVFSFSHRSFLEYFAACY